MAGRGITGMSFQPSGALIRIIGSLIFGVILAFFPATSINIICYIGGGLTVLFGAIAIIQYFRNDAFVTGYSFTGGMAAIAGGLIAILLPGAVASVLPILFGFAVIVCAMIQLELSVGLARDKMPRWFVALIASVIMLVLGILILVNPFGTTVILFQYIGIALIADAIMDASTWFMFRKAIKKG